MDRDSVISPPEAASREVAVDTTEPDFSADDLLAQINAQLRTTEEGLSTREICVQLGMIPTRTNTGRVWRSLTDLMALGRAEFVGKKTAMTVDGSERLVPAYKYMHEKDLAEEEVEVDDRG